MEGKTTNIRAHAGSLQASLRDFDTSGYSVLTCRSFLFPVSVHERAACPGNCLMHPPPPTITFIGCCDHMTSDQPIIALSWLHVIFASLWNLIQWHNAFKEMQYLVNQKNKCFEINLYQAIQFISQHLKGGMSMFQSLLSC